MKKTFFILLTILLLSFTFVSAGVPVVDNNGQTLTLSANAGGGGYLFSANTNTVGEIIITRYTGTDWDDLEMYNVSGGGKGTLLASNYSNTATNVSLYFDMVQGEQYIITADKGGVSYNRYVGGSCSMPYPETNVNFTNGWHDGLNSQNGACFNFVQITTTNTSGGAGLTHNISGAYLSPNSTVYTDEEDLRAYVTVNDTTDVYVNYTYFVNAGSVATGQYTGSAVSNVYTLPVLSNTTFSQNDNVTATVVLVNQSTGTAVSNEVTTSAVTITNRVPTSTLSWTTNSPLNDTNFSGIITPGDSDLDNLNITWTLYKNGVVNSSGSDLNNAHPYGSITLFTIDSATTNIGDTFTFNVSVTDGYDVYTSGDSENATVTASQNFTVSLTDEWSGSVINDYNISILSTYNELVLVPTSVYNEEPGSMDSTTNWYDGSLTTDSDITGSLGTDWYSQANFTKTSYFSSEVPTYVYVYRNNGGSIYNNYTLNTACATAYNDTIRIRQYFLRSSSISTTTYTYCHNGSSWVGIGSGGGNLGGIYEIRVDMGNKINVSETASTSTWITGVTSNATANVTLSSTNYFSKTYNNHVLNQTLNAELFQSQARFNVYEYITNNTLSGVTLNISGTTGEVFNLTASSFTVTASKSGYYNKDFNFTTTALTNHTFNITNLYTSLVNFSVTDGQTGSAITSYNGWVYDVTNDYNITFNSTTQYKAIASITGSYVLWVEADGYVTNSSNRRSVTVSSGVNDFSFTLYPTKTFNVIFLDELTGSSMSGTNINMTLTDGSTGQTVTTTAGSYLFENLSSGSYTLQYGAVNYTTRYYYFTITNNTYFNVTLYMLSNSSGASPITIEVIDEEFNNVVGAVVKALKYNASTGTYYQVTTGQTDDQGETILYLFKNTEFYKFIVQYNGVTVRTTDPAVIINDNILIPISISTNLLDDFFTWANYDASLTFNSATDNFRFTYNDVTGAIETQACLKVYKLNFNATEVLYNSTCSTSSAATILVGVTPTNGTTYVARAYYDTTQVAMLSQEYSESTIPSQLGWLLQLLLTIAFAGAAAWDVSLLPVGLGASLILGKSLGLFSLPWSVVAGIMVIAIIISMIINKNKG